MTAGDTDFDHVILTRFSVRFSAEQPPADEDWLAYRWAFFRDALASSLSRQTERGFIWLVFFDASSPEWLREEVAELSPGLFLPVWLDEPWGHTPLRVAVSEHTTRPWLITTRIDSDDAVAVPFVQEIQSHFAHQDSQYINLLHGVQVARSGAVYRYWKPVNSFISYVEKRDANPPRTVFQDFRHAQSIHLADVLNVVGPPRWMQVVHGSNLMNDVRGPRIRPRPLEEHFDLALPYRTRVAPLRLAAEWGISVAKLGALWVRRPWLLKEFAQATRLRAQGTRVLPRRPPAEASTPGRGSRR